MVIFNRKAFMPEVPKELPKEQLSYHLTDALEKGVPVVNILRKEGLSELKIQLEMERIREMVQAAMRDVSPEIVQTLSARIRKAWGSRGFGGAGAIAVLKEMTVTNDHNVVADAVIDFCNMQDGDKIVLRAALGSGILTPQRAVEGLMNPMNPRGLATMLESPVEIDPSTIKAIVDSLVRDPLVYPTTLMRAMNAMRRRGVDVSYIQQLEEKIKLRQLPQAKGPKKSARGIKQAPPPTDLLAQTLALGANKKNR